MKQIGSAVIVECAPGQSELLVHEIGKTDRTTKEIWLEDVVFVGGGGLGFVHGTVIEPRPVSVLRKHGWHTVEIDKVEGGCFHLVHSGVCIQMAKYARLKPGKISAFGAVAGTVLEELDELEPVPDYDIPTYGPPRKQWTGDMGGNNYELATVDDTLAELQRLLRRFPDAVIVDGSDDWDAPDYVRPQVLVARYGITPLAWWHTGRSGQTKSGVILRADDYSRLREAFRDQYGFEIDSIPGTKPVDIARSECGCWRDEGIAIYCAMS